jgi:cobalamin biosynthesis Mg chelatase CobN
MDQCFSVSLKIHPSLISVFPNKSGRFRGAFPSAFQMLDDAFLAAA